MPGLFAQSSDSLNVVPSAHFKAKSGAFVPTVKAIKDVFYSAQVGFFSMMMGRVLIRPLRAAMPNQNKLY